MWSCVKFERLKKVLTLLYFVSVVALYAQQPAHRSITKQTGLPANAVYNIVQDKQHYIWLGTDKGLLRYDGIHYKNFLNADLNGVSDLRIDDSGILRCQSFSNKHYYVSNDTLLQDSTWPRIGNFAPVVCHAKDSCYQLSRNVVYLHADRANYTLPFLHEVLSLFTYKGKVWAFDGDSLYDLPYRANVQTANVEVGTQTVFFSAAFQGKVLLVPKKIHNGRVYELFPEQVVKTIPIENVSVQSVRVLRDSLLFICTNSGLYVLDRNMKLLPYAQPLLQNKNLSDVFEDSEGKIWVTTLDNGVFQYDFWSATMWATNEPVSCISYSTATHNVLAGTVAGEVYELSNAGKMKLAYKISERQPVVNVMQVDEQTNLISADVFVMQKLPGYAEQVTLAVKKVLPLHEDAFLLARTGGFSILSASKKIQLNTTVALYKSSRWQVVTPFVTNGGNVRVRAMVSDGTDSVFYVATSVGLLRVTANEYTELTSNGEHLLFNDVAYFKGKLYGVSGKTVFELDVSATKLIVKERLLKDCSVKNIRTSSDALWVSDGAKILRLSNFEDSLTAFSLNNGYEVNDFCIGGGKIFIASDQGITAVPLQALPTTTRTMQFHIHSFTDGKQVLSYYSGSSLSHNNNNLSIKYSIPYYGEQEDLHIYYRLNGGDWQTTETGQRELKLISLEPGNYVIHLQAESSLGQRSSVQEVKFSIQPPIWKTWWFYVLSMCTVAAVGYALYAYRIKLMQQQNILERQKIELENKLRESILASVKAQMNPHFIFNSLNTIQSFIYLNDKQNATTYLGKFSQLTRTILDMSNKNSVSLQEEIDAILLYLELEKTRFDDEMNFTINVSADLHTTQVHIPSMIIQPYVENAVKHGLLHKKGERWLKCSFEMQENFLRVTIDDNGIGRTRSAELNNIKHKQHQSFATKANEKRLEALNKDHANTVSVQYTDKTAPDGQPQGTTVVLMIAVMEDELPHHPIS